jgi:addiction module RelE/StbE family toxin
VTGRKALKQEGGGQRRNGKPSRKRPLEVEYLPVAIQDLFEIIEYIRKDNPGAAAALVKRFDEALGKLGSFPEIGPVPKDERLKARGYRVLVIENYLAFYVVHENAGIVEVRRVLHGRRRYSFLL